jgi:hypothetical protein
MPRRANQFQRALKTRSECVATVVESAEVPGEVFMLLIACAPTAGCERCTDARARLRKPPAPPAPKFPRAIDPDGFDEESCG